MEEIKQKASFSTNPPLLRAEMETELRTRAYKDEAFEQALKSDPRGVLEREYPQWFPDGKIPEGFTIRIIQEEEDSLNVVLLTKRAGRFTPLREENLTGVQGGRGLSIVKGLRLRESETTTCGTGNCPTDTCVTAPPTTCSCRRGR
jgi:hypothetical protein